MIATMFFAKLAQPPDGTDDELIIGVPAAQELRGDPLSPPALVRLLACRASGSTAKITRSHQTEAARVVSL